MKTQKITVLRDKLIAGLSEIPHSILNGEAQQTKWNDNGGAADKTA